MFTALIAKYLEDDEYRALQAFLAGDPEAGRCHARDWWLSEAAVG